ncbi:MAG: YqaA family protein [Pseudomonadota bacterium]
MIRRLYDWTLSLSAHPHALWALAIVSFAESSFFPIPPDLILIPMVLARPNKAFLIAGVCLVASVLGGVFGYAIGYFAYQEIGVPIFEALGKMDSIEEFNERFRDVGFWAVLVGGLTPFPYKVMTILSGSTGMPLGTFIVSSIVSRGLRFFIVAGLLWKFGAPIKVFIEKYLGLLFTLFVALLIGGFYLLRFL